MGLNPAESQLGALEGSQVLRRAGFRAAGEGDLQGEGPMLRTRR